MDNGVVNVSTGTVCNSKLNWCVLSVHIGGWNGASINIFLVCP